MTMLFGEIYYLSSTELVRRPSDILGIFQYAKRNRAEFTGRGVMLINNEVIEHIYDENSVENEIIGALRDNRVEVFYQPIYNTKTHKFTSAEALVRIRSREGNIIPPGRFIAVAEKRGSFYGLESACLRRCADLLYSMIYMRWDLNILNAICRWCSVPMTI